MTPITDMPAGDRAAIRFVLCDIDDTMTCGGRLPAESYGALWALHDHNVLVIPVTGRPAGWCDLICRQWPVAAVIGENGAFAYYLEDGHRKTLLHPNAPEPEAIRERLASIAREAYRRVPGSRPAKDQFARIFDVAVDFCEEPPHLDLDAAERIREVFEEHGAHAKVSSIHVNAWFGDYDKRSMAAALLEDRYGLRIDRPAENATALFCGDSPNDEPMFEAFVNSAAVANIGPFLPRLQHLPRYVTAAERSAGFAEVVSVVLDRLDP